MLKQLMNVPEQLTYASLRDACAPWNAQVHAKVALADVIGFRRTGLSDDMYQYAIRTHFDFVVTDADSRPQFAVEFDGPVHLRPSQKANDGRKGWLCREHGLPLLRLTGDLITRHERGMSVLAWLVNSYFVQTAIDDAQQDGLVPLDEVLGPSDVYFLPGRGEFPMQLHREAVNRIWAQSAEFGTYHRGPSVVVGQRGDVRVGLAWFLVSERRGIACNLHVTNQDFPADVTELLTSLLVCEVRRLLEEAIAGDPVTVSAASINRKLHGFRRDHTVLSWYGGSGRGGCDVTPGPSDGLAPSREEQTDGPTGLS